MDNETLTGCSYVVTCVLSMIFSLPGIIMLLFTAVCLGIWVMVHGW